MQYILTLDQGTTSSRAIIFDHQAKIVAIAQQEFPQIYPHSGWVEHNPELLWETQLAVAQEVLKKASIPSNHIAGIGIANQRETTILWNRKTGKAIYNAIVWQDRRTAAQCEELKKNGAEKLFRAKTGLLLDPYFSGTKIQWILNHVTGARELAKNGELAFGTVDSWLLWKLTNGQKHLIEISNASRTLLYNIHQGKWDEELLKILDIPRQILPEVVSSSEIYSHTAPNFFASQIPIAGMAGDQQAALFGQRCIKPGLVKNTYGTGCFMLMSTGKQAINSKYQLLTTIAWKIGDQIEYALEGSVFMGGAIVQWLRDGLHFINDASEIEALATSIPDNDGVYLVPAFAGLGAPDWDPFARGLIIGMTRGTTSAHIARAALESIAFQVVDLLKAMESDVGIKIDALRVDGAASSNHFLMQFQADLLGIEIQRPQVLEITALGATYLAGLAVGFWKTQTEIDHYWTTESTFTPQMPPEKVHILLKNWHKALERSKQWIELEKNS